MIKTNKKIILGSKSPRRKELLEGICVDFSIRTKDTDESFPESLNVIEVPLFIANNKALALIDDLSNDEIVICADTVVIVEETILGKPLDEKDAVYMLKLLSGKTHQVITGVVIASKIKNKSFSVTTEVTFKDLSDDEIKFYIENYKPYDKAGGYGIQEWIGYIGVTSIKGSYFNVVGLPIHEVYHELNDFEF
jgi:septum formation protein